ncbi:hypothetical protein MRX96_047036 [Rhipicephalus microplus]
MIKGLGTTKAKARPDWPLVCAMQIFGIVNSPLQCCGEPVASSGRHTTTVLSEVLVLMVSVRCRTILKDATPRTRTIQHHKNCCTFPLQGVRALWNAPYDSDPPPHVTLGLAASSLKNLTSSTMSRNHCERNQPRRSPWAWRNESYGLT